MVCPFVITSTRRAQHSAEELSDAKVPQALSVASSLGRASHDHVSVRRFGDVVGFGGWGSRPADEVPRVSKALRLVVPTLHMAHGRQSFEGLLDEQARGPDTIVCAAQE